MNDSLKNFKSVGVRVPPRVLFSPCGVLGLGSGDLGMVGHSAHWDTSKLAQNFDLKKCTKLMDDLGC